MDDPLDRFIQNLQQQIFDEAREVLGDGGFDRWQSPKYNGRMDDADAGARVTGSCGDTMEIYLKFDRDRVTDASYVTNGCGSSDVCGSFAAEMAIGHNPDEIVEIDGEAILARLGRIPEEDQHCAFLAAETLQTALHNFMIRRGQHNKKELKPPVHPPDS